MAGGDDAGVGDEEDFFHAEIRGPVRRRVPPRPARRPSRVRGWWSKGAKTAVRPVARQSPWQGGASCGNVQGAPFVKELKQVAFVRLVPGNVEGGDGAEVEAFDQGRLQKLFDKRPVPGDGGNGQGRPDSAGAFRPAPR